MKRILLIPLIVAVFALPQIVFAQLQWQKVGKFPGQISVVYFTDEFHGFVAIGQAPGGSPPRPVLFRTTDGAKSWTQVSVDQLTLGYGITDIVMTDTNNGWACGSGSNGYSLWHTTDGGITWKTAGKNDNRYSVCIRVTSAGIVVSDFYNQHLRLSADGGTTFNDIFSPATKDELLGMDFSDNLHGVLIASYRSGNPWYYTADGGTTWSPSNLNMESWSVYGEKGTSNFFATPEMWSNGPGIPTTVYGSTDYGKTWNTISQLTVQMTGSLTGVGTRLYAQTEYTAGNAQGIYRSADSGKTWKFLGGPGGYGDTRFISLSSDCNSNVIYAPGSDYNLYKSYDTLSAAVSNASSRLFSARIINDSNNITIHLPIYFHHSGTMNDVDLIMHYPSYRSLKYLNGIAYNGKSIDVAGSQWAGRAALHFAAPDLNAAPDSLIGYVDFLWIPYEYDCDQILFDSIDTHGAESPCSATSTAEPFKGIIGSYKTCDISGIAENEISFLLPDFSICPNPTKGKIEVSVTARIDNLRYELFDALGIARKKGMISGNSFQMDISELAAGNYYLRVSGKSGVPVTERVVITK